MYNFIDNCGKEEEHIKNMEKINKHFNDAFVGFKSYVLEYRERGKVKNW